MTKKLRIHDSFWLLIALILLLDDGQIFLAFLIASVVHELGHFLMVKRYGGTVTCFHLSALGGLMQYWLPGVSRHSERWIALAGPCSGLLLWQIAAYFHFPLTAGASLLLSAFNLLPIAPLDGGLALESVFPPGHWLPRMIRLFSIGLLLMAGIYSGVHRYGWGLALAAICLLAQQGMALQSPKIWSKI